jgi:hypothetical protein
VGSGAKPVKASSGSMDVGNITRCAKLRACVKSARKKSSGPGPPGPLDFLTKKNGRRVELILARDDDFERARHVVHQLGGHGVFAHDFDRLRRVECGACRLQSPAWPAPRPGRRPSPIRTVWSFSPALRASVHLDAFNSSACACACSRSVAVRLASVPRIFSSRFRLLADASNRQLRGSK